MMLALLILAILGNAFSNEIVRADHSRCAAEGPKYWCQNAEVAEVCKATSFCEEHVWKNTNVEAKADLCMTCQQYVGTLHMILANNATEGEIIDGMKQACAMLPASTQAVCTEVVTLYGKEMVDALIQYTAQPIQFCTMIGLCNGSKYFEAPKWNMLKATDYCLTCEQYLGTIHLLLSNPESEKEVIAALESSCSYLPAAYQSVCTPLMATFAPEAVKWLVNYIAKPQQFCSLIGLCKSTGGRNVIPLLRNIQNKDVYVLHNTMKAAKIEMPKSVIKTTAVNTPKSGQYCEACLYITKYVDKIVEQNSTEEEIKAAFEESCTYLSAIIPNCKQVVDQYADQAIKMLVDGLLKPEQVCLELGLCPAKVKSVVAVKTPSIKSAVTCELCTLAMGYIDKQLKGNTSKAAITQALDKVCSLLPSKYTDECDELVNQYSDIILNLLIQQLDPSLICKEIQLCASGKLSVKHQIKNAVACELCTVAMGYLDNMLAGNKTEEAVTAALDKLCGYLPSTYSSECKSLVDTYGPQIVKLIVEELANPTTVCTELGLCSSKKAISNNKISVSFTCEVCEVAMQYLSGMLAGNQTVEAVEAALEQLCNEIPGGYAEECDSLVETYSPEIIKLIVQELADPSTICTELGLCTTKKGVSNHKTSIQTKLQDSVTCEVCTYAMGYLDGVLGEKKTEAEIKAALDDLCNKLPQYLSTQCVGLVQQYGDEIVKLLVEELTPSKICAELKLCSSKYDSNHKYMMAMRMSLQGASCTVCEYAMGYLDSKLESKPVEQEIEGLVEDLCNDLPAVIKNECDALITEYGDNIIRLVIDQFQPATICKELKLC